MRYLIMPKKDMNAGIIFGYWNRTEYLGIGTGAASLINNQRFVEGGEIEVLSLQNQMEEYMFLGLIWKNRKGVY